MYYLNNLDYPELPCTSLPGSQPSCLSPRVAALVPGTGHPYDEVGMISYKFMSKSFKRNILSSKNMHKGFL